VGYFVIWSLAGLKKEPVGAVASVEGFLVVRCSSSAQLFLSSFLLLKAATAPFVGVGTC